jgi:hypothetical protein
VAVVAEAVQVVLEDQVVEVVVDLVVEVVLLHRLAHMDMVMVT